MNHVFDPPHLVTALEDLKAAVLTGRRVDRDRDAQQVGVQAAVLVPIAVILVPIPGAAATGTLERHFGMVVVNLAAEETRRALDHALTPCNSAE